MAKLTRKPKSDVRMELLALSKELCKLSSNDFINKLSKWQERHKYLLNEKTIDENGKWRYTHTRLRSANYTLKTKYSLSFCL